MGMGESCVNDGSLPLKCQVLSVSNGIVLDWISH